MRYLGGKVRTARRIVAAISEHASRHGAPTRWVEPFMGGGSVTVEASRLGVFTAVHSSDIDPLVVAYWSAIRDGWVPATSVTYEEYVAVRNNPAAYPTEHVAHVAYTCSFGGKRWGGYARGMRADGTTPRNYADEASRRDSLVAHWLGNTRITCSDYADVLPITARGDVVYCDPPYADTTGYKTGAFDPTAFWSAVQSAADRGVLVYVSEYTWPDHVDSEVIWSNAQSKSVAGGPSPRPRAVDNVVYVRPRALTRQKHMGLSLTPARDHLRKGERNVR